MIDEMTTLCGFLRALCTDLQSTLKVHFASSSPHSSMTLFQQYFSGKMLPQYRTTRFLYDELSAHVDGFVVTWAHFDFGPTGRSVKIFSAAPGFSQRDIMGPLSGSPQSPGDGLPAGAVAAMATVGIHIHDVSHVVGNGIGHHVYRVVQDDFYAKLQIVDIFLPFGHPRDPSRTHEYNGEVAIAELEIRVDPASLCLAFPHFFHKLFSTRKIPEIDTTLA